MSTKDILRSLTRNEITVLYWKCRGLQYGQIAVQYEKSIQWVQGHMTGVYKKLSVDKRAHSTERWEYLRNEVCPVVAKLIGKNTKILDSWPKNGYKSSAVILSDVQEVEENEDVEEDRGGKIEEDVVPDVDEKVLAIVISDEKQLSRTETVTGEIVSEKPRTGTGPVVRTLAVVSTIVACLAIIALVGVVYWMVNRPPSYVSVPIVITATSLPATQTPLPSATLISSPTSTLVPTQPPTPEPTITPAPPTPTAFVPPADGILFQDNFQNGLNPEWQQYSGKWIVSNGKLTLVYDPSNAYTDTYSWIGVENPNWKNYIVSLTIHIYQPLTESDEIALAVRDNTSGSKYIGFEIDFWPHIYLSIISQGYSESAPIAGDNKDFTFPLKTDAEAEIKVENNDYTLSVNGTQLQTISISGYDSGGFRIGLYCRGYPQCPTFDNVKATY